jgi:methylenetetrahydrofolate reductase (NADPH)
VVAQTILQKKYFEFVAKARKKWDHGSIIPGIKPLAVRRHLQEILPQIFRIDLPKI